MARKQPLMGEMREHMVRMIHEPLTAYLKTVLDKTFTQPPDSEALDITADAVGRSLISAIGRTPEGHAALMRLAFDLLDTKQPTKKG